MYYGRILIIASFVMISSIYETFSQTEKTRHRIIKVTADAETDPIQGVGDAADDPAIWIHPSDPSKSRIIGTNKKQGINVYNLGGKLLFEYNIGRINNIDVRYGFPLGDKRVDIVAGSNRSDSGIIVMAVNPQDGSLSSLVDKRILTSLGEVYGFCLYHDRKENRFFAFINSTNGNLEQWEFLPTGTGKITARMISSFKFGSQTEGCVVDDEMGFLYVGEEDRGIWKIRIDSAMPSGKILIDSVKSGHLKKDVEGLTIYYAKGGKGYLIASSQGNNSFAVYHRDGNNGYIGSFRIINGEITDGVKETDGIDVTSVFLDARFPSGCFIAQDGKNKYERKRQNQNFKMVSWKKIAESFNPPLFSDNGQE